jgi:hypothetical protein
MSITSLFGSTQIQEPGGALKRKLLLLRETLPKVSQATQQAHFNRRPFTAERRFFTKVITPCLLLSDADWNFQNVHDEDGSTIDQLLKGIDCMIIISDDSSNVRVRLGASD